MRFSGWNFGGRVDASLRGVSGLARATCKPCFAQGIFGSLDRIFSTCSNREEQSLRSQKDLSSLPARGSRFVDELIVQVRGGKGGNGCESFWRSNHKKSFGADGGHGGKGGDVIFEACSSLRCLGGLQQIIHATNGSNGQSKAANGKNGKHRVVDVPQGTLIWRLPNIVPPPRKRPSRKEEGDAKKKRKPVLVAASHPPPVYLVGGSNTSEVREMTMQNSSSEVQLGGADGSEEKGKSDEKRLVGDLSEDAVQLVVARGGAGGRGNIFFKGRPGLSQHEKGAPGEDFRLLLQLKVVADVGFVGAPNAGKSTLLGALTGARPEVADYAFTTLRPYVGSLQYEFGERVILADIPGLIKGAHANRGLGHSFLKHVERSTALAIVVDCAAEDPWMQVATLMEELELYQQGLSARVAIIIANKVDLTHAVQGLSQLQSSTSLPVIPISAMHGTGIPKLQRELYKFAQFF